MLCLSLCLKQYHLVTLPSLRVQQPQIELYSLQELSSSTSVREPQIKTIIGLAFNSGPGRYSILKIRKWDRI